MTVVAEYLSDVLHRRPMFPDGFQPDWADHPWQHKVYRDAPRFPLTRTATLGTVADGLAGAEPGAEHWPADLLAGALLYSYGLLSRRLRITANPEQQGQLPHASAVWARGSAAGGGLYPCEIYWVRGGGVPGIYHYLPPQHAMQRIAVGDVRAEVHAALDGAGPADADYLLVSVKFWKNAFKYADFCYHSVTMDLGCLLGTWQAIAASRGVATRPLLWFEESTVDALLGLDPLAESVFAVVPMPGGEPRQATGSPARPPRIEVTEVERSSTVRRWPRLERVQQAIAAQHRPPSPGVLDDAAVWPRQDGEPIALPDPAPLDGPLREALRARRSSFGRFSARPPLHSSRLAALLAATGGAPVAHPELHSPRSRLVRAVCVAQHVEGLAAAAYDYDESAHTLTRSSEVDAPVELQRQYALSNYNLQQAAALIVLVARPHACVEAAGERAYRLLNAEIGALAQRVYLSAAALGVGCGAVLGIENAAVAAMLGLHGTDTWPMLLIMVGPERGGTADLDTSLLPRAEPPR